MRGKYVWANGWIAGRESIYGCVGKGWRNLLSDLLDDLEALGWDGTMSQVKEKFGGLRFYCGGGNDAIFDRISKAEDKSLTVCEDCGETGRIRTECWWLRTLCDACNLDVAMDNLRKQREREET